MSFVLWWARAHIRKRHLETLAFVSERLERRQVGRAVEELPVVEPFGGELRLLEEFRHGHAAPAATRVEVVGEKGGRALGGGAV